MPHPIPLTKRKANYAFCVKFIAPNDIFLKRALAVMYYALNGRKNNYLRHFMLDIFQLLGKIRLTLKLSYLENMERPAP